MNNQFGGGGCTHQTFPRPSFSFTGCRGLWVGISQVGGLQFQQSQFSAFPCFGSSVFLIPHPYLSVVYSGVCIRSSKSKPDGFIFGGTPPHPQGFLVPDPQGGAQDGAHVLSLSTSQWGAEDSLLKFSLAQHRFEGQNCALNCPPLHFVWRVVQDPRRRPFTPPHTYTHTGRKATASLGKKN